MLSHPKTTIFMDLDQTVMQNPFYTAIVPILRETFAQHGVLQVDVVDLMMNENTHRLQTQALSPVQIMDWDDILQNIAQDYGVVFEDNIEQLVRRFSTPPYISVLDNALEVMKTLLTRPNRQIVASTMGLLKYQQPVIDALGLAAYFADILAPDVTGYLKTSRPFFRDYLDDSQAINIMVGDNYIDDVVFPKSFDLYSFWIPRKPWANDLPMAEILQMNPLERPRLLDPEAYTVCPDAILVSLDELIPLVEQIEQQEPKTSL